MPAQSCFRYGNCDDAIKTASTSPRYISSSFTSTEKWPPRKIVLNFKQTAIKVTVEAKSSKKDAMRFSSHDIFLNISAISPEAFENCQIGQPPSFYPALSLFFCFNIAYQAATVGNFGYMRRDFAARVAFVFCLVAYNSGAVIHL